MLSYAPVETQDKCKYPLNMMNLSQMLLIYQSALISTTMQQPFQAFRTNCWMVKWKYEFQQMANHNNDK